MRFRPSTRLIVAASLALSLAGAPAFVHGQRLLPPPRRQGQWAARPFPNGRVLLAQDRPVGPGLQLWMEQHRNLPPAEQERALENDPGYRALTPPQQQHALNQLRRLQAMTPEQRNRSWALLRMTPQQREQFDLAVQQYTELPPPRQLLVHRAFGALRRVPPPQRQAAMGAYPPLRQLSPYERQVLANLLFWEPYLTAAAPNQGP